MGLTFLIIIVAVIVGGLASVGAFGSMAAGDWLITIGTMFVATLIAVLTYRGMLASWIRRGAHPAGLRLSCGILGIVAWLLLFVAMLGPVLSYAIPALESSAYGPPILWLALGALVILFATFYFTSRTGSARS
jgi:hypothetical protein